MREPDPAPWRGDRPLARRPPARPGERPARAAVTTGPVAGRRGYSELLGHAWQRGGVQRRDAGAPDGQSEIHFTVSHSIGMGRARGLLEGRAFIGACVFQIRAILTDLVSASCSNKHLRPMCPRRVGAIVRCLNDLEGRTA